MPVFRVVAEAAALGKMTLMGNINNPQLFLSGTPAQVREACNEVLFSGVQILAPEYAVPLTTPLENLMVLVEAADHEPS